VVPKITGNTNAGGIYEFDLTRRELRKVVDTPFEDNRARFQVSEDGRSYCVVCRHGPRGRLTGGDQTLAFLYCEDPPFSHNLSLKGEPRAVAMAGHHFFFQISRGLEGAGIFHYDMEKKAGDWLRMSGGSTWEIEDFEPAIVAVGPRGFRFWYFRRGSRLSEGTDYTPGAIYLYDVGTGSVGRESREDSLNQHFNRALNNRFVWFEGAGSPLRGRTLVSSKWPSKGFQEVSDPKGRDVKVLKRFPRPRWSDAYELQQMSPCRRYVVICLSEEVPTSSGDYADVRTYYVVGVEGGKTSVLLTDNLEEKTRGHVSRVYWVPKRGQVGVVKTLLKCPL
jgi:hypothetical protein